MKSLSCSPSVRPAWRKNILATAVLLGLSALSPAVNSADRLPIGDLEIYQSLVPGNPNLMIMIDVSESMRGSSILEDFGNCSEDGDRLGGYKQVNSEGDKFYITVNGEKLVYRPYSCQVGLNKITGEKNAKEYDRISRLQITLIRLLADTVTVGTGRDLDVQKNRFLPDSYGIGIGIFGYEETGEKAKILSPVGQLTSDKREELIRTIIDNTRKEESIVSSAVTVSSALIEAGAYMMGTTPYSEKYANYSGFPESTVLKASDKYISPPATSQCSGKGIFLLTGDNAKKAPTPPEAPEGTTSLSITKAKMNLSLGSTSAINTCSALGNNTAWSCMGEYAQQLRSPSNPSGESIKTATAGIGSGFRVFTTNQIKVGVDVDGKDVNGPDCSLGSSDDTKYLCQLGGLRTNASEAFGNGKFYPIYSSSQDSKTDADTIAKSIADFASGLAGISSATPAGTITIPDNPYQVSEQLPYAYLPMLQPNISSSASIWKGNLKKYQLNQGTLYGNSDQALYSNIAGDLTKATQDIWQSADFTPVGTTVVDNSSIKAGGVYAKLTTPTSQASSVRTVYVEDTTAENKPILRKLSVTTDGKLDGFNALIDPIYTDENKRRILSFLGFKSYTKDGTTKPILDINGNKPSADDDLDDDLDDSITLIRLSEAEAVKLLGGVVHSKPTAISYSANLDANGRVTNTREDYAIFGSMDGALHMVKDADGTEEFAIIPKKMIADQSIALVDDSKVGRVGQPYFGVDAPWLVTTDYKYDLNSNKVTVDTAENRGMFAYGGLRMGGEGLYGIDITNKSAPKMLFTITPEVITVDAVTNSESKTGTAGFGRLGQIWSKPTAARIRMTKSADPIDVLVFGGGYDMQYEDDNYVATTSAPARGNAIYMINANTGALIWSTSGETGGSKNTETDSMIHSVTGGITVLDRDNDGLMDHLYAADLGGQVFRADFQNARPAEFGFTAVDSFSNKTITRVLNTASTNTKPYRFYERPVVSFYRNEGISGETIGNAGRIFALVNVVSGNRSAPLSKLRTNNTYANRVYGIIDTDITSASLYAAGFTPTITNLTESNLLNLSTELGDAPTDTVKQNAKNKMIRGTNNNKGWYYPLTRFDGYQNVKYNKGVGDSVVINSILYTTVYNPDKMYSTPQSCVTSILGGSERQLYCLPYGICSDSDSKNGTGGYVPAGQGIQELTLGAFNKDNTDIKILIGTRTIADRINQDNRIAYNAGNASGKYYDQATQSLKNFSKLGAASGGDGSAVEYLFNERYTLQPKEWYEQTQGK